MSKVTYTTICHQAREALGLSLNEYAVADIIDVLQSNPRSSHSGWCYKSKRTIGDCIGLTEQAIHKILNRLYELGLIEKDDDTKHIRTTDKWYDVVRVYKTEISENSGTLNEVSDNKISQTKQSLANTKQSSPSWAKQSLDNKNIANNNNDNNSISRRASTSKFIKPTAEQVSAYAKSIGFDRVEANPSSFIDYYESNGWKVGKNPMKDWQATIRQWKARDSKPVDRKRLAL